MTARTAGVKCRGRVNLNIYLGFFTFSEKLPPNLHSYGNTYVNGVKFSIYTQMKSDKTTIKKRNKQ